MNARAEELIRELSLRPHPEGGYFRETHRSDERVRAEQGERAAVTAILYLLPAGERSRRHRVHSDEVWMHHQGDGLQLSIEKPEGTQVVVLGDGGEFQAVVPASCWQEAEPLPGPAGFVLVGCVVAPGFEFQDFELS